MNNGGTEKNRLYSRFRRPGKIKNWKLNRWDAIGNGDFGSMQAEDFLMIFTYLNAL